MSSFTKPDVGVILGLGNVNLPRNGVAVDLGFGSARNLKAMARLFPENTFGYDNDPGWVELAEEAIRDRCIKMKVVNQDVMGMDFMPNTLSIAGIGIPIYLQKSNVKKLFGKVWTGLKKYGVLHADLASLKDGSRDSDFFVYSCEPYPETGYTESYNHYCGAFGCPHYGASYWNYKEIQSLLESLGQYGLICNRLDNFIQYGQDDEQTQRSFYRITVQKL